MKEILKVENLSIKYITGDFKSIGLKEYVMHKIKRICGTHAKRQLYR